MIGVSVGTLRNWEQGRRVPGGTGASVIKNSRRNAGRSDQGIECISQK